MLFLFNLTQSASFFANRKSLDLEVHAPVRCMFTEVIDAKASSALPRFRRGPGQGVWLSFVSRRAIRDMHPLLRTARPEMNRGCQPGGIVQRAGLDVAVRISGTAGNVIQAGPAVRAEPALHRFHGTGPPSEHLRLTFVIRKCSCGITAAIANAAPDCRWHSVQWQAYTTDGGPEIS